MTDLFKGRMRMGLKDKTGGMGRLIVSSSFGVVLFIFMLWYVGVDRLWLSFGKASPTVLAVTASAFAISYLVRAWRWKIILSPVKNPVKFTNALWITTIGFLVNAVIPVRVGEFMRAFILDGKERVGFLEGFSSVVVERLLDLLGIVALGLIALMLLPLGISLPDWLVNSLRVVAVLTVTGLVVVIAGTRFESRLIRISTRVLRTVSLPAKWREKTLNFIKSLLDGAKVMSQNPRLLTSTVALTFMLWMTQFAGFYFLFKAFSYDVSSVLILLGFIFVTMTFILPAAPGYVGTYEIFWSVIFVGLGLTQLDTLLAMGVVAHLITLLVIFVLGCVGVVWLGLSFSEIFRLRQPKMIQPE